MVKLGSLNATSYVSAIKKARKSFPNYIIEGVEMTNRYLDKRIGKQWNVYGHFSVAKGRKRVVTAKRTTRKVK